MNNPVPVYTEDDRAIGRHLSECLLLRTMDDVAVRSRPHADLYEMLGIAAGLRLVLIDKRPLIHLARERLRLPQPLFEFTPYAAPAEGSSPGAKILLSFGDASFVNPSEAANLSSFRRAAVGQFQGSPITVDQAIKYFANVHGGVHAGRPESELERSVQRLAVSIESAAVAWAGVLRRIAVVTARALEPTCSAILAAPARVPSPAPGNFTS